MTRANAARRRSGITGAARARGFALVMALVVLAATGLAAAALVRAVDTTTTIAGNLALRQASIPAADAAIEDAVATLSDPRLVDDRERDLPAQNYYAARQPGEDSRGVPWMLEQPGHYPAQARTLDTGDGTLLRWVIERVCLRPGPATAANCALTRVTPPAPPAVGAAGAAAPPPGVPVFRITVRVDGPQNTLSYVQATVRDPTPLRRLSWRVLSE